MNIILIRHGQSIGNKDNLVQGHSCEGLSELGHTQAREISNFFSSQNISGIYSSDTRRAIETATPTAEKLNLKIKSNSKLREAHFGLWEKMTYDEVKEKHKDDYNAWHNNYFIRPSWFESYESHHTRVKEAIEEILKQEKSGETILVFTHGGSIKTQVGFFKKLSGNELTKFSQPNCSLAEVQFPSLNYSNGEMIYYSKSVI